jgi:hypothetical protein
MQTCDNSVFLMRVQTLETFCKQTWFMGTPVATGLLCMLYRSRLSTGLLEKPRKITEAYNIRILSI